MTNEILEVANDLQRRINTLRDAHEHMKSRWKDTGLKKIKISSLNPNYINLGSLIREETFEVINKVIEADLSIQLDDLKDQWKRL
jgi:hypothetical protein